MFGSEYHLRKSSVRQFGSECFLFKNPFVMSVWCVRFSTTWGAASPKQLQKITSVQKKCVRNVACKHFKSHTSPIFSKYKIMKFNDILKYEGLTFMHKFAYARLPNSLLQICTPLKTNSRNGNYLLKNIKANILTGFPRFSCQKCGMIFQLK